MCIQNAQKEYIYQSGILDVSWDINDCRLQLLCLLELMHPSALDASYGAMEVFLCPAGLHLALLWPYPSFPCYRLATECQMYVIFSFDLYSLRAKSSFGY